MKAFLDKYVTIVFDMDGVITSEESYWDCAALTVYEFTRSKRYFGTEDIDTDYVNKNVDAIRKDILCNDKIKNELKDRGVNSNWDLAYVIIMISLITESNDSKEIYAYTKDLGGNIIDCYDGLAELSAKRTKRDKPYFERNGQMWTEVRDCFQEWYLGDEEFYDEYNRPPFLEGKQGVINNERPIIAVDKIQEVLCELSKTKRICTATGRPYIEALKPLRDWDLLKYIAPDGFCIYNHVTEAENASGLNLTKPHPYMLLKAILGTDTDDTSILNGEFDKSIINKTLMVGDAGADIFTAQKAGADFCAVLTGAANRTFFEENGANYICNSIYDMIREEK